MLPLGLYKGNYIQILSWLLTYFLFKLEYFEIMNSLNSIVTNIAKIIDYIANWNEQDICEQFSTLSVENKRLLLSAMRRKHQIRVLRGLSTSEATMLITEFTKLDWPLATALLEGIDETKRLEIVTKLSPEIKKAYEEATKAYGERRRTRIEASLYGIEDVKKFQVKREPEASKKRLLQDISWNIRDDPSEAQRFEYGENGVLPKVNLSQQLFHGPILLELYSRYSERTYRVPVFGGTIGDILSVIHKFYQMYEDEDGEDEDEETYNMGDGIWFESLDYSSPEVWYLCLGSM